MKSKNVLWVSMLALAAVFTGCSKDPLNNLTDEESRIYITDHDSTVNFASYNTYTIADSVAVINNGNATKESTATDVAFINAVKAQMQSAGFTLVSRSANPDLAVNVNRIYNTSTGIISYNNYYDYYGGYWDPYSYGYGGFGYYSPYSYATYSIREGALSVDVLDLKNAAAAKRINVIWTGLIRGTGIFNAANANQQIGMLFNQSSYLKS
jgi:hypothetical protein